MNGDPDPNADLRAAADAANAPRPSANSGASSEAPKTMRRYKSEDLFRGSRLVFIQHEDSVYRLQITSNGKLILQK